MNVKQYDFYSVLRNLPFVEGIWLYGSRAREEEKPNDYPWYDSFLDLGEALEQLQKMVNEPETEKSYVRDATIQRFKFSFELFWKTLKKICIYELYDVTTPRSVFKKAFELKLIDDEGLWITMINDRNLTSHTYKRKIASEIYYKINSYHAAMQKAYAVIKEKYKL